MAINTRDKNLTKFIEGVLEEQNFPEARFLYDDPTTFGFTVLFSFDGDMDSPLFNENVDSVVGESAIEYLEAIDEGDKAAENDEIGGRAKALKRFKENLRTISKYYPYYFKSINGLGNIHALNPDVGYEADRILTFETIESIDTRIGELIEDYQFACYDQYYRRQIMPGNLKEFKMWILVHEIRKFRSFVQGTTGVNGSNSYGGRLTEKGIGDSLRDKVTTTGGGAQFQKKVQTLGTDTSPTTGTEWAKKQRNKPINEGAFPYNMKDINKHLSTYVFEFQKCRFDFTESHPSFETLTNEAPEMVTNSFKIKIGRMKFKHKLRFLDLFFEPNTLGEKEDEKDKPGNSNRFVKATKDFANKKNDQMQDFFKKEADVFLQENDPRLQASRFVKNKYVDAFDKKFKSFLFGNVLLGTAEARARESRNEILKRILGGKVLNKLGIDVGKQQQITAPDLGNKGAATEQSNFVTNLPSKDLVEEKESKRNNLGSFNLADITIDQLSDLGVKEVSGVEISTLKDLGAKTLGELNLEALEDLSKIDVAKQGDMFKAFLGNTFGFDGAPFSSVLESFIKSHLGNIATGGQSEKATDLGNVFNRR